MPDDHPTIHVRLTPLNHDDQIGPREFDLRVGEKVAIGRASTNVSKPEFSARRENAYIDSPIISRHHASFCADSKDGVIRIQLEDHASMHGTLVNGQQLDRRAASTLSNNDVLQFGTDISRVNETFVARKYRFSMSLPTLARLSPPHASEPMSLSHSRGFHVPEGDSEDDEYDADDLDDLPLDGELGNDFDDIVQPGHNTMNDSMLDDMDEDELADSQILDSGIPGSEQSPLVLDDDSSASEESENSEEEEEDDDEVSEADLSSLVDEDKVGASYHRDSAMEFAEQSQADVDDEESLGANVATSEAPLFSSSPASVRPPDVFDKQPINDPKLGATETFPSAYPFAKLPFGNLDNPPVTPTMPIHETPAWANASYIYDSRPYQPIWHGGELPGPSNYMGSNFGDRPSLFSQAPQVAAPQPFQHSDVALDNGPSSDSVLFSDPSTKGHHPMETSSPAARRTKVTIDEIVEGQPQPEQDGAGAQQPLHTEAASKKRKAEEIEDVQMTRANHDTTPEDEPLGEEAAVVAENASEAAAAITQRPIRQPTSILKKMSKHVLHAAAFTVAGGVSAVALLSNLPDGFFQV